MNHYFRGATLCLVALVAATPPLFSQPRPQFVFAGDSLTAGYQNSQLVESGQSNGYASLIAKQAGFEPFLPLFLAPGFPQITVRDGFAIPTGFSPVPRSNPHQQTLNVAVPGQTVGAMIGLPSTCPPDASDLLLFPINYMTQQILNPTCDPVNAATQLEVAAALGGETTIVTIGGNDVLFSLLFGVEPTSPSDFAQRFAPIMSVLSQTSKHLVVATVPDVTALPYLYSLQELAEIVRIPAAQLGRILGLAPGDLVTPYALQIIQASGPATLPEALPTFPFNPVVIRAERVRQLRLNVLLYNGVIRGLGQRFNATVVDLHGLFNELDRKGIVVLGQRLTTDFGGGLFSMDGVHPTNTGYAIMANEFIKTMNRKLQLGIPPVSIVQVAKRDPLMIRKAKGKGRFVSSGTR